MGNGVANIIASLIIAGAIVGTSVFEKNNDAGSSNGKANDKEFIDWYARAVGDIRNDIVVNCGCCGEGEGQKSSKSAATRRPTRSF